MSDDYLLRGDFNDEEDAREQQIRPQRLSEFQGQEALKENLSIFIRAARERGESLDHVFVNGPPGLGKTTLAGIMAHEMGVEFKVTSAPALDKPKDLVGLLTTLTKGTVFFIDEIHRLKPAIEEMLYIAMEDFEIDWVIGQGPGARSIRIPVPSFTLIGATTKAGLVSGPLYSRFGIPVRIDFYSPAELKSVIIRSCRLLEIEITPAAIDLLAECARGTPRVANRLLRRMRDYAQVMGNGIVDEPIVRNGLNRLEIDMFGLERQDREILKSIIEHYAGGPVGAETLAISVGESIDTLEDFYEPYLIQKGFLMRTPRGRMATQMAYEHLGIKPADSGIARAANEGNEDQRLLF